MSTNPFIAYGQATITGDDRQRLIEEYLPLVHHVLGRMPLRMPPTLDREDLFEVGVLGLIHAADTYNPGKGASFKTYAFLNVRGAILDELRKHDAIPRSRRDRMRVVGAAEAALVERLDRIPTPEEIAKEAGLSIEQIEECLVYAHGAFVLSLDDPVPDSGGDSARLIDCLSLPNALDPSEQVDRSELRAALVTAIRELPERERQVILLYYAEELRLKEIGEILGVSESRVSQIHARAIYRLKKTLDAEEARTSWPC